MTGGRPPFFHDLCVGEALAHAPKERENSGGGKFTLQISRRKDQAGSFGTEEKPLSFEHLSPAKQPFRLSPER